MIRAFFLSSSLLGAVVAQTSNPTSTPTATPTSNPTSTPTASPTSNPTSTPTASPTSTPTSTPTASPTTLPTANPTTSNPSAAPTSMPSASPSAFPTVSPTFSVQGGLIGAFGKYQDSVFNPNSRTENVVQGYFNFFQADNDSAFISTNLTINSASSNLTDLAVKIRGSCQAPNPPLSPNRAGGLSTFAFDMTPGSPLITDFTTKISLHGKNSIDFKKLVVVQNETGAVLSCTSIQDSNEQTRLRLMFVLKMPSNDLQEVADQTDMAALLTGLDMLFIAVPQDTEERKKIFKDNPDLSDFNSRCSECNTTAYLYVDDVLKDDEPELTLEYNIFGANRYQALRIMLEVETASVQDELSFDPTPFELLIQKQNVRFKDLASASLEPTIYYDLETAQEVTYSSLLGKIPVPLDTARDIGMAALAVFLLAFLGCCVGGFVKCMYLNLDKETQTEAVASEVKATASV